MTSRRLIGRAVLGALLLSLCQCLSSPNAERVRSIGTSDLSCPTVEAYRADDGLYVARGCGKFAVYDCEEGGHAVLCVPHARARVEPDPTAAP